MKYYKSPFWKHYLHKDLVKFNNGDKFLITLSMLVLFAFNIFCFIRHSEANPLDNLDDFLNVQTKPKKPERETRRYEPIKPHRVGSNEPIKPHSENKVILIEEPLDENYPPFSINFLHSRAVSALYIQKTEQSWLQFSGKFNFTDLKRLKKLKEYFDFGKYKVIDPHFSAGVISSFNPHDDIIHYFIGIDTGVRKKEKALNFKLQIISDDYKDLKTKASGYVSLFYSMGFYDLIRKEDLIYFYAGWYSPALNLNSDFESVKNEIMSIDRNKENLILGLNYFPKFYSYFAFNLEVSLKQANFGVNRVF